LALDASAASAPAISQTQGPFNAAASRLKFSAEPLRPSRNDDLLPIDANAQANAAGLPALAEHRSTLGPGFRLSPRATGTDGFYIATFTRT
jgi:16S rRNA C967 or C1407 C5-methylase (RsmB/RsmF family)